MDELSFRRQAYADPNSKQADFVEAQQQDPTRQAFVDDLKRLDGQLEDAFKVDVPENLADKLLLTQKIQSHQQGRRRTAVWLSMAASVAFVAGLTFNMLRTGPINLNEHALAHVMHEVDALHLTNALPSDALQVQLASYGKSMSQGIEGVVYAKECDFQGIKSLHWIVQTEQGPVTLFIVPKDPRLQGQNQFAQEQWRGKTIEQNNSLLMFVGENSQAIEQVQKDVETKLYSI
ncbi:DUF3379 family protein [Paraferrimonas sedimenticola]|uniref:DUF3379 domain-containing protein n=1 Tax=Paraferrimonas sedimenticola TaxID=375674 RepID=A0AA37RWN9_9GAMM|nr:DUF3379 family protein [Paraferrimonas sedimenticola]GLP96603.1 hypothetical protein GCM10007895_19090 [Paraferrimonas sedimenticola]